jgi:hypothetical protein
MADLSYEQKTDRLMYTVYGNGEIGLCEKVEDMQELIKDIQTHHAKEPFLIETAIAAAFENRFGKKNSSILLVVAICSCITGIGGLILGVITSLPKI